jgi:hypothetical protein
VVELGEQLLATDRRQHDRSAVGAHADADTHADADADTHADADTDTDAYPDTGARRGNAPVGIH